MAKKKPGAKVPATAEPVIKHARIELPEDVYERLKKVAERSLLPVAAYIRRAVLNQIEADEERLGGKR
jgi:predicted DNA-binding protein